MENIANIRIGQEIRTYLENLGYTQTCVAEKLHITQGAVSAYYRGKPFGKNAAKKWAATFGFRENWLITGEGDMLKGRLERVIGKIQNTCGWEKELTMEDDPQPQTCQEPKLTATYKPQLSNAEILLRDMLAEKEAKIDALQEVIWELKAENGRLKEQLRTKGGDARNAEDSLSVTA